MTSSCSTPPATGHVLGLLHSPWTFGAIARVGPIFGQAEQVRELLEDDARSGYLAVTQPTDMAVGETLDLRDGLNSQLGRELDATIVNATLPRRFDADEMARIAHLDGPGLGGRDAAVRRSARLAAQAVHERARIQHNQIARLRRGGLRDADGAVRVLGAARPRRHPVDRPATGRATVRTMGSRAACGPARGRACTSPPLAHAPTEEVPHAAPSGAAQCGPAGRCMHRPDPTT